MEIKIISALKRDNPRESARRPELFLSRLRQTTVPRWGPVVTAAFACAYLMAPSRAWAFSEVGTGLQQNATIPEKVELTTPVAIANGGTGGTTATAGFDGLSPMTAVGDLIKGSTSGTRIRLALGSANLPLKVNSGGTDLEYATLGISGGGTGQTTATAAFDALAPTTTTGDVMYHNGTDNIRLAVGGAGTVLKVSGGVPTWGTDNSGTAVNAIVPIASSVKFDLGATSVYFSPGGRVCTTEADCRTPVTSGTYNNLTCLATAAQTASDLTVTLGAGVCTSALTYDGAAVTVSATANTAVVATGAKSPTASQCIALKVTSAAGMLNAAFLNCTLERTA